MMKKSIALVFTGLLSVSCMGLLPVQTGYSASPAVKAEISSLSAMQNVKLQTLMIQARQAFDDQSSTQSTKLINFLTDSATILGTPLESFSVKLPEIRQLWINRADAVLLLSSADAEAQSKQVLLTGKMLKTMSSQGKPESRLPALIDLFTKRGWLANTSSSLAQTAKVLTDLLNGPSAPVLSSVASLSSSDPRDIHLTYQDSASLIVDPLNQYLFKVYKTSIFQKDPAVKTYEFVKIDDFYQYYDQASFKAQSDPCSFDWSWHFKDIQLVYVFHNGMAPVTQSMDQVDINLNDVRIQNLGVPIQVSSKVVTIPFIHPVILHLTSNIQLPSGPYKTIRVKSIDLSSLGDLDFHTLTTAITHAQELCRVNEPSFQP